MSDALEFNPDHALAEHIRAALPRRQDGDVLGWIVADATTGEWCMRCDSRSQARILAGKDGAIYKVVKAH